MLISATGDETRQIINALVVNPKEESLAVKSIWRELSTTERKIKRESQQEDKVLTTVRHWVERNKRPERINFDHERSFKGTLEVLDSI